MRPAIQAIIFDFDGTIFDTETHEFRGWASLYREHGLELSLAEWQQGIGTWGAFDPWLGLPEHVQADRDRVHAALHAGIIADISEADVRPGVRALIDEARRAGLRLAIATSSDREWVERWLAHHGLQDAFESLATRYEVDYVKPDPALYALALRNLGLPADAAIAVEDSLNGATAAVAAGLRTVVVPNEVTHSQPFPPTWPRLNNFDGGLRALLDAAGVDVAEQMKG